jgi:hypothetical protein
VNVFFKNRRHALITFIKRGASRPGDYQKEHWESLKHLITLAVKQEKVAKNCAMKAHVVIPNHSGCGGEVGATRRLVRWHTTLIIPCFFFVARLICLWKLACMWTCSFVVS